MAKLPRALPASSLLVGLSKPPLQDLKYGIWWDRKWWCVDKIPREGR